MRKGSHSSKARDHQGLFLRGFLAAILLGVFALVSVVVLVSVSPVTGTAGADLLRSILGNQPVADIEAMVFTIQDSIHHVLFTLRDSTPTAPWQVLTPSASPVENPVTLLSGTPTASLTPGAIPDKGLQPAPDNATPTAFPSPTSTPTEMPWMPAAITPLGNIPDEGVWQLYISNPYGQPVAYRTFLQPDSSRPYVTVAVVALDLTQVQLHYQLGSLEPEVPGMAPASGTIPANDLQPGILLAAFNGGFKTTHGHYGVFFNGTTLIPMIDGIGTLVIYNDERLGMGEWGVDLVQTPDMLVIRQNCPLVVNHGQITPAVYNNSIRDWGGTIDGHIVTFRSGIGLSQDGKTLYYFAGNYLNMPALAASMVAAGAYQAMQLDINNYYVHFTSFEVQNGKLVADPLLPKEMVANVDRYLGSFPRDFFYVTTK